MYLELLRVLGIAVAQLLICSTNCSALAKANIDISGTEIEPAPQDRPASAENQPPIVITGRRHVDISDTPETEFDENDIGVQGADNIQDLLSRLQPFINPDGDEPVLLINGRPAGFDRSILSYPAEALARLTVFKPGAGVRYGATSGKRVVNLVLKRKFASLDVDGGISFATAGGEYGSNVGIARTVVSGDTRWNARVRIDQIGALLKSARRIPPRPGAFDSLGYVTGTDGGEIDPALSMAAGETVAVAAIPTTGAIRPTLTDFLSTANQRHPIDPNVFETLLPSTRKAALSFGVARPIGNFSASFDLDVNRSDSSGLNGIPMVSALLPAGSRWSPFSKAVILNRPYLGKRALRSSNNAQSFEASFTLTGAVHGVQISFAVGFSHYNSHNLVETGVDNSRFQQLIDSNDFMFDPYGPLKASFLQASRSRSRADNINVRINLQKSIINLPAGAVGWSFAGSAGWARNVTMQNDAGGGASTSTRLSYAQWNGQMTLNLPISRRNSALPTFGDLSIDLSASRQYMAGSNTQTSISGGVTWAPFAPIQFRGSINRAEIAPSFDQLARPVVTTVNRIFDYAQQQVAEPAWTTGGNPDLQRGSQKNLSLSMMVRPLSHQELTFNFDYRRSVASGGPAEFPDLTPAVEAAFPERITRDSIGRLIAVDARSINIIRNVDENLSSSVALRLGGAGRRDLGGGTASWASDPIQINLSLIHQFRLRSELLIRHGLPAINRLNDDSGTSRHMLDFQLGAGKRAFGTNLSVRWSSTTRVTGGDGTFRVRSPLLFNLTTFANPDQLFKILRDNAISRGIRMSLDVLNVFNGYRRVTLANGSVPVGYTHDEIDPLGRTVRLTLRKRF